MPMELESVERVRNHIRGHTQGNHGMWLRVKLELE